MDSNLKKKLRALSLELRHVLERDGDTPGDLHLRLNELGIWPDRPAKSLDELVLTEADRIARDTADAFLTYRQHAGVSQKTAFDEFVRESAYSWANRLFTLRCMEARNLIDLVILQQQVYGGRSLIHHRFSRENPAACTGEDDGMFAVLALEFQKRAAELPAVFDPHAPAIALRPSVSALKRCIALLSGAEDDDALFQAGDALGWAYQFWNAEEKDRVFERVRTQKGAKIEGSDLIPATQLYTEPYMVKFLVQNSLGALWAGMYPESKLPNRSEYYLRDADRTPPVHPDPPAFDAARSPKPSPDPWVRPRAHIPIDPDIIAYANTLSTKAPVTEPASFVDLRNQLLDAVNSHSRDKLLDLNHRVCEAWDREWPARRPKLRKRAAEITFLDPACGSGHFLLEAFDLLYDMYLDESPSRAPEDICASILNHNLFGVDIDQRAIQIAHAALWMHARERAELLKPQLVTGMSNHLVAANLALPRDGTHLKTFLEKHPQDAPLAPALEAVFQGLSDAAQLGTLLRVEEPVDQALRRLKEEDDRRASQLLRESQGTLGFLPEQYALEQSRATPDYASWKRDVLDRLEQHFLQDAAMTDPVQAFFGRDARQGLALFDLLASRYDVVSTNPPYMGSRNMGKALKRFCLTNYTAGKRDLYSAFMLRCVSLARPDGYVAMVTQQSWMFLRSFANLRAFTSKSGHSGSGDLLRTTGFETLAHLGANAFPEISGEVVNTVLFCLRNLPPRPEQISTTIRLVNAPTAIDKERLLKSPAAHAPLLFSRRQSDFLSIQYSPIVYWLSDALLGLICKSRTIKDLSFVRQGVCTTSNPRFTRYFWEVATFRPGPRWFPFEKGGGALRWVGFHQSIVDWQHNGARVKAYQDDTPGAIHWSGRMPDEKFLFKPGWTFSRISGGTLAARMMPNSSLFCNTSPAAIPYEDSDLALVGFWMNTRLLTYLLRSLTQRLDCQEGYVQRLPLPLGVSSEMAAEMVSPSIALRQQLIESVHTEPFFRGERRTDCDITSLQSLYMLNEAAREEKAFEYAQLSPADIAAVLSEVGRAAGSLPLIVGYDALPGISDELAILSPYSVEFFASLSRSNFSDIEIQLLRERLHVAYEASLKVSNEVAPEDSEEDTTSEPDGDEEDDEAQLIESRPIPCESRLEAVSTALQINPISIHWLIREGVERYGWERGEESAEATMDTLSIALLRRFGYRWPSEGPMSQEGSFSPGTSDGIISITNGLFVRHMIEAPAEAGAAIAFSRFEEVVGTPPSRWLEREFFPRHIRQFRNRPIVWQVQTKPVGRAAVPVLTTLIYYHRIQGVLPSLRTGHAGLLRSGFETELRTLELLGTLTTDQNVRKERLGIWIEELCEFQDALERIEAQGFATERLRAYAISDGICSMTRRWLRRLRDQVRQGPLADWRERAAADGFPPDLPSWISGAVDRVDRQCAALAPPPPPSETADNLLTPSTLADLFAGQATSMVGSAVAAICHDWETQYDKVVVQPLKDEVKAAEEAIKKLPETVENFLRRKELKAEIKKLKKVIVDSTAKSKILAAKIQEWRCPEAELWVEWLANQPLYDEISSLYCRRQPPRTVAEFIAQESQYQPDTNDGVRVNIAPLQKAGVLARDVLTGKDVDKAIADRAAWRADERRWVRQGILPQPGWWPQTQEPAPENEAHR